MTGSNERIKAWRRRQARSLLFIFFLTLVFAGWRLWVVFPEARFFYLHVHMKASTGGMAQVYYDTGGGLSENASTQLNVPANDRFRDYRFRLPRDTIHFLRFDPLMSGGTVRVKNMVVVDAIGRTILSVDLRWIHPGQQIQSLKITDETLIAVMAEDGADPQLAIALPAPLDLVKVSLIPSLIYAGTRVLIEAAVLFAIAVIILSIGQWFLRRVPVDNRLRRIPAALILAALAIVIVEGVQHGRLPAKAFYHEVDELLYRLGRERFDAEGVILGNSVAYQVFSHPSFLAHRNMAVLATNEAVGMTGQYFIMERYLQRNRPPRAVILITWPLLEGSLSHETADNYLCRTFTRPGEILDVLQLKRDPLFALKSIAYRFFPSFKYRLQLQQDWLGLTNAPIYTGVAPAGQSRQGGAFSMTRMLQKALSRTDIPECHFLKLLDMLHKKSIPLHFVSPPLKEKNRSIQNEYRHAFASGFPALKKNHPFFYWSDKTIHYPDRLMSDEVHFSEEGLPLARSYLYGLVEEIMRTGNLQSH